MSQRATIPPVTPLEFAALVPNAGDSICSILIKFFRFQVLEFKMWKYKYGTDGMITEAYGTEICLALESCPQIGDPTSPVYVDDPVYGKGAIPI